MKLILCEDYDELSSKAAQIVAEQLKAKPDSVLGLATGATPVGMYRILVQMNRKKEIDFSKVKSFNLDEYYPISDANTQSYHYFMKENLFSKIDILPENTHILNGLADDPEAECERFEEMIESSGGIDLQVLGIGQNGHIGFNEPSVTLNSKTHLTPLTESTINANSRFFERYEDVPRQALTMGMGTIFRAKKIILLASGENKNKVVSELMNSDINTSVPATMLKLHPDVTLICDKTAYMSQYLGVDIGGTEIKFGVVDSSHKLVHRESIQTNCTNEKKLIGDIADKCREIMEKYPIAHIGVGTPGIIHDNKVAAVNLPFNNTELEKKLSSYLDMPVKVSNDANCAALGEAVCGAGKSAKNIIMITIGTGIGGGIIIGGKIYQGRGNAGEIGHMCIQIGGKECSCGLRGCWERYASVSALVENAEKAAKDNVDSVLHSIYNKNGELNGKLIFEALEKKCPAAQAVFSEYLHYLAAGIDSLILIFDPDMIVLSGGITGAGDKLINPLLKYVKSDIPIKISSLKSDAGIYGAALMGE